MQEEKMPYKKQIFICTNDAHGEKPSCGDHKGEAIFQEMRRIAKERGLHPTIRVAQAKCLGQCVQGCNIMVYPENVWYKDVRLEDVSQLVDKYLSK